MSPEDILDLEHFRCRKSSSIWMSVAVITGERISVPEIAPTETH